MNVTYRNLLVGISLLVVTSTASAQTSAARGVQLPPYSEVKLENGATILIMEKKDVPLVAFTARLRGGSVSDPAGKEGVAALTATLLERGTAKYTSEQFAEIVESAGGRIGTSSSREAIVVAGDFMARDADLMLSLLVEMLRRPTFPEAEVEKIRQRSIEEITAAKDSDPRSLMDLYFNSFLFAGHPYGRPSSGSESSLAGVTRKDVLDYYSNEFGGNRLTLALVGDFDAKSMRAKVERAFGDWPASKKTAPAVAAFERVKGRRVLLIDKPDATQTYFWIGNVGVARNDPDRVIIDLANTVFGGRFTSMLNSELRIKTGLTYGANSQLIRDSQPGAAAIASYTKTETTSKAIDLALDVLKRYRSSGMDPATLTSVKSYVLGQFPPRLETNGALASRLTEISFYGLDRTDVDKYAERINTTTQADVSRIIERLYPAGENLVFVLVGNAAAIRDEAKKYGAVTEMKITDKSFSSIPKR